MQLNTKGEALIRARFSDLNRRAPTHEGLTCDKRNYSRGLTCALTAIKTQLSAEQHTRGATAQWALNILWVNLNFD